MAADDAVVEAALARHGATITRHDLAVALGWELARVERALGTLDRRLATTGLRLARGGWDSYRLTPRPGVLGSKAEDHLQLAHGGRVPLEAWAAALLSHIITGAATSGLNQDVPEPYRSTGIEVLLDRGLITTTRYGYRPSDEVIFSPTAGPLAVLTHLGAVD
jgi:hypothetical protein